jgi:type I restriction enzyme S subunit
MSKNTSAIALLEKHFDIAFAAPDGIKKLRELILSLAMQGKLVAQDPSDRPASELLKEIEAEKQRLVKEGKIKQSKALSEIKPEELPYDLPKSWKWVRIIDVVDVGTGSTPATTNSEYYNGTIPWYTSSATNNSIAETPETFITELAIKETNCKVFPSGSLIIAMYGQGKTRGQISEIVVAGATNQAIAAMVFYESSQKTKRYIKYYFVKIYDEIRSIAEGAAQPNLNVGKIKETMIPLPPLAEQRRIVAKIDELMARCDELEKLRGDHEQKRTTVHTAALNRLLVAQQGNDFNIAWKFITQHFGELYSVKENVAELRKVILQLAVMGKLTPQDPSDQPASELLKAIKKEKERLIQEGKIKKSKPLPKITSKEKTFMLPLGWEWFRLQDILDVRDGTHDSPQDANGIDTYPLVTSKNFINGKIDFSSARQISANDHFEIVKRSKVEKLDILFSMIGGNIGNQVIVEEERDFSIKNVALFKYYNKQLTSPYFIKRYLEHIANSLQSKAAGGAQPFVSLGFLRNLVIALPPKEEQHRIVAKIDQLMTLCDELEKQIDNANSKQTNLLNSVMTKIKRGTHAPKICLH